jgi:hypothetical protein
MNAFKSQQFRWAKGSIQVARKLLGRVLVSDLPRSVKVEAFFHLTQNVPYLITLALAVLAAPALAFRDSRDAVASLAFDLPLISVTTATLVAYCVTSQRAVGAEPVWRVVLRVPILVAITAGICVSQARAVIEGMFGLESEFVRTPKHGIVHRRSQWRSTRYRGTPSLVPLAELALAVYCAFALVLALAADRHLALPVLAVFLAGFAYVGARSALRI